MFIEKMFKNTFGMIWLLVFLAAVFALIVWMFTKKDKVKEENNELVEEIKEEVKGEPVVETEVTAIETKVEEKQVEKEVLNKEYEIIEGEDGFFRVRKIGAERTLRKFSTRIEAEDFIEKRGLKHD